MVGFVLKKTFKKIGSVKIFSPLAILLLFSIPNYSLLTQLPASQSQQEPCGQREEGLCPVTGSGDQTAVVARCVAVPASRLHLPQPE